MCPPSELPLYIDETPAINIAAMSNRARRIKRLHGLDMIVVDYIQLMKGTTFNKDGRVQEISQITQGLKAIAKELGVPVVALSQLSRQVEQRDDHKPLLADLRESGSIEQDADDIKNNSFLAIIGSLIVVFLYILLRFRKWQFSLGAVTAVFHDVLIVLGIFSLTYKIMPFNMEIDQAFIAAILTVWAIS